MKNMKTTISLVIACILFVHLLLTYNSLFKTRIGFIYHPQTDFLFKVFLKPEVHRWSKWKYLIPFTNPDGYRISSAQWKGELTVIESAQKKMDAIRVQASEISKHPQKVEDFLRRMKSNLSPERLKQMFRETLFIEIYHYSKLVTSGVFPDKGMEFEFLRNAPSNELEKVDAVITIVGLEEPRVRDVVVLERAVLITGQTAFFWITELGSNI